MNNPSPTKPEPIQPIRVRRHPVDWGANSDLDEITAQRVVSLGPKLATGCWFLCPRFTVSSPAPTAEFFRRVLELRSSWLLTCRQSQGTYGQRQEARKLQKRGQRGAFVELNSTTVVGGESQNPPESIPWSILTNAERQEVTENGRLAKQLGFSGVLFIDGNPVPPRTWQARADELLKPKADASVTTTRRKPNLAALKATGDPEPLKTISRSALQEHLDRQPSHATYVNPLASVSAPTATPAFYSAAKQAQAQWYTLMNRTLGCGNVRRLRRATDTATICLVFSGTLVVDGQVYLTGCWPIHAPKPSHLKKTPFQSPTVPPSFLALKTTKADTKRDRNDDGDKLLEPNIIQSG